MTPVADHESRAQRAAHTNAGRTEEVAAEFLRRLLTADTAAGAARAAVDAVRASVHADVSWCGFVDGDSLTMAAHSGLRTSRMQSTWRLPLRQGIGGRVAVEARPMAVRDYRHDPRRAPVMKTLIDEEGMRAALCAPLLHGQDVLGVLYAASREAHDWSADDVKVVSDLALEAAAVIHRLRQLDDAVRAAQETARFATEAQRLLESSAELSASVVETDDMSTALAVLAQHLGMQVEVVDATSGVAFGRAGAGLDDPVRLEVDLHRDVAARLLLRGNRNLTVLEDGYVQAACHTLALHLQRERAGMNAQLRVIAEFTTDLLEGGPEDRRTLKARAALLALDLHTPRHVACVGSNTAEGRGASVIDHEALTSIQREVVERHPGAIVVPRGGDVTLLIPADGDLAPLLDTLKHAVRAQTSHAGLAAGVGRLCRRVEDYADSYAEAALALDLARSRGPMAEPVLTFRDLGLYGLLVRGSTRQTMQEMVNRALGPLLSADAAGGPDYVRTMHTYLTNDRHLERTAAALHVHPNTVRYRVARVQELCQVNLRDPDDRFLIELALRVQVALQQQ